MPDPISPPPAEDFQSRLNAAKAERKAMEDLQMEMVKAGMDSEVVQRFNSKKDCEDAFLAFYRTAKPAAATKANAAPPAAEPKKVTLNQNPQFRLPDGSTIEGDPVVERNNGANFTQRFLYPQLTPRNQVKIAQNARLCVLPPTPETPYFRTLA